MGRHRGEPGVRRKSGRRSGVRRRGFSAIEALIAMTVLGVMLLTLISVFIYGFGAVSRARQTALATQIVQERMEAIRALPFDSISALGTSFSDAKLSGLYGGTGFQAVEAGPGDDIKKVTVGVRWTYHGSARNKRIVTYMTREGINKI
jgi:prepilin-type N-terminal cleavage/methylation domain-containing protein